MNRSNFTKLTSDFIRPLIIPIIGIVCILGLSLIPSIFEPQATPIPKNKKRTATPTTSRKSRIEPVHIFHRQLKKAKRLLVILRRMRAPKNYLDRAASALAFCTREARPGTVFNAQIGKEPHIMSDNFPVIFIERRDLQWLKRSMNDVAIDIIGNASVVSPTTISFRVPGSEDNDVGTSLRATRVVGALFINAFLTFSERQTGLHFLASCREAQMMTTKKVTGENDLVKATAERWRMYVEGLRHLDRGKLGITLARLINKNRSHSPRSIPRDTHRRGSCDHRCAGNVPVA